MSEALAVLYLWIGALLTFSTRSRGLRADILFTLLWPLYWYDDWRKGRL